MHTPILLFDGVCNLCNGFVQFMIEHDKQAIFRFAALQSEAGERLLARHNLTAIRLDSVVLIYKGKAYTHSDAPLETARLLGGFWQLLYVFKLVPKFIRDSIYRWVAKNRYRWFGKQEACWLPTPELKARFLSE